MGGYSKIKAIATTPATAEPMDQHLQTTSKPPPPMEKENQEEEEEETETANSNGELRRNFSTASLRFMKLDRQGSSSIVSSRALQGALRRAFSVRSSASSDKYSRIYDDAPVAALGSPVADGGGGLDDGVKKQDVPKEKKRKSGRIFKACKRIFRL